MPRAVRAVGCPGSLAGALLAGTFFFFIGSLTRTTVANTFVLMSVSPFLAAIAARVVLNERVPARTWIAMAVAFAGIVVMFGGRGRCRASSPATCWRSACRCCFAAQLTVLRKFHATVDMLPMVMIAGLCVARRRRSARAALRRRRAHDLAVLALMGCVQLGAGCLLLTAASRTLSATELGLLALLEPILGPLWVWVLLGEHPAQRRSSAARSCCRPSSPTRRCAARRGRAGRGRRAVAGTVAAMSYDARSRPNDSTPPMKQTFLDFEQPIAELQAKIDELRFVHEDSAVDITDEIARLTKKSQQLTKDIYSKLSAWQIAQVARHPQRPYTLDYIAGMFTDFRELHGDRTYADDAAIVGGLARFNGKPCMVIGHQKGRDTKEKIHRNFGMPRPEGYRKALRLMKLAEKFGLPLFTFVDTPGAYPGHRRRGARAVGSDRPQPLRNGRACARRSS